MKLKRALFRPGRRIEQIGKLAAHPFFTRQKEQPPTDHDVPGAADVPRAPKRRPFLSRHAENAGAMFSIALSLVLVAALVALLVAFVLELRRDSVVIEGFRVPRDLAERGYDSVTVSERLLDEIRKIQKESPTIRARRQLESSIAAADIQVAGGGLSMKSLVRYVRQWLALPESHIGGEITREDKGLHLVVRERTGRRTSTLHVRLPGDDVEELIRNGARSIVQQADPYVLAAYLYQLEQPEHQFPQSQEAIEYVLRHPPADDDPWALILWGNILDELGRPLAAIEKYRAALALQPGFPLALGNWANVLKRAGQRKEALARHEEAARLNPDNPRVFARLGDEYVDERRWTDADAMYARALRLDPDLGDAHAGLAYSLARQNRFAEAFARATRGLAADPDGLGPQWIQFLLHWAAERTDDAAGAARQLRATAPASNRALIATGLVQLGRGEAHAALDNFDAAIRRDPRDADAHYGRGEALLLQGRFQEALAEFDEETRLDNAFPEAHLGAARALEGLQRLDEAWQRFEAADAISPGYFRVHREWGRMMERQGRSDEAKAKLALAEDLYRKAMTPAKP